MFNITPLVLWPAKWYQIHFSIRRIWPPQHLRGVSVLMIYTSRKTSETLQLRVIFMATRRYKWVFPWIPNKGGSGNEEELLFSKKEKKDRITLVYWTRWNISAMFFASSPPARRVSNSNSELGFVSHCSVFIFVVCHGNEAGQGPLVRPLCIAPIPCVRLRQSQTSFFPTNVEGHCWGFCR